MLKLNNKIIELNHFPDGTLHMDIDILLDIDILSNYKYNNWFSISWKFEANEELVALIYLVEHIRSHSLFADIVLWMDYIPNARMDRVKNSNDVFTLKYFANIINSLNFKKVYVVDPHSPVAEALINNICISSIEPLINSIFKRIGKDIIIYFPDASAKKKYEDLFKGCKTVYSIKRRDWETGKIKGLAVITNNIDLKDKTVLMFDDIISYGGSMYYSALKLKELGVDKIYAYATHTENSILDKEKGTLIKLLEDGTVERLFTTNSLFTGEHDKITVL